ncbi:MULTISPECIES: serine/threonine protein phosphatase [unclassified Fusibacter]|uniref:serine/threonine protein phosphatase n=1 Tax=unclassified Fusibacter TaxID=2624464 RepID=UPI001011DB34|nr:MULTISPECIES: serine/threonine protein phosphatase [unclassified Fusibacter]MCK8060028.1 serine/threonine protein phosphatase [Fusibacter sp. A2]NPE22168.1 serine/threonine protein phosphatase [Fusibacter sp. A1]RXV60944.1 serine/threonine protein phosphatase [Fusibacter sp. A1]
MNTMKRLLHAYEAAIRIPFDDNSRFIFFSDVHRGDNSISDEFAHNQNIYLHALNHYFNEGFTYIEVGDGDELWEHSNFKHIRTAHSATYMKLKEFYDDERFIMLYGNHNMSLKFKHYVSTNLHQFFDEYNDYYAELFPGLVVHEAVVLQHKATDKEVFVVHGHQGDFINDQVWRMTKTINRHFWHYLHIVGFRNPASPAKNLHKRHKIEKNYSKWIEKYQKMLIVGHTHRPKFATNPKTPYFNTGSCIFPRNITGIEIANGNITLIDWRIRANEDGNLFIRRKMIRGPEPLSNYML